MPMIPSHNPLTITTHDTKGFSHRVLLADFMEAFEAGEFTIEGLTFGAIRQLKRVYKAYGGKIPATKRTVAKVFRIEPVFYKPFDSDDIDIFA